MEYARFPYPGWRVLTCPALAGFACPLTIRTRYADPELVKRKEIDVAYYNLYGIEVEPGVGGAAISSMIVDDDAHANIIVSDALNDWNSPEFVRKGIRPSYFDLIMTNPSFGLTTRVESILNRFEMGRGKEKQLFEILLLERALQLLKPGGRCVFVLPDINFTREEVIKFLRKKAILLGIISLPAETFLPYGSGARTSLLVFRNKRSEDEDTGSIFMAKVHDIGYDATGRTRGRNALFDVVPHFHNFLTTQLLPLIKEEGYEIFQIREEQIDWQNLRVDFYAITPSQRAAGMVPIGQIAEVLRGYTPGWHKYTDLGVPILKVRNLTGIGILWDLSRRGHVSDDVYDRHPKNHVELGDILLTASAHSPDYIGRKVDIVDSLPYGEKCMAVSELLIIRCKKEVVDPYYLLAYLKSEEAQKQLRRCIKGTTAHIYPDDVGKIVNVPLPPLEIQSEIGTNFFRALLEAREAKEAFEEKVTKVESIIESSFVPPRG
jgi:type I restriction enzyme M protein